MIIQGKVCQKKLLSLTNGTATGVVSGSIETQVRAATIV